MTNVQRGALAAVSVALVALGLFLILGNEPAPNEPSTGPVAAQRPEPVAAMGTPSTPGSPSEPTIAAPAAAAVDAVRDAGAEAQAAPHVELAPSPFEGSDSAELQYAVKLVLSENTGPHEWHKAAEVFQRCVDQNPTNHLCKRGVYAAWERIDSDGGRPTALSNTGSLGVDPTKLANPVEPRLKEPAFRK